MPVAGGSSLRLIDLSFNYLDSMTEAMLLQAAKARGVSGLEIRVAAPIQGMARPSVASGG